MKKVEVYFLINLGAILSLFAIEGELAIYMARQDDILKNVAQDKLQTLVEINNVESNYEDPDHYRLFFDVEGQYEKGSVEFNPSFTTSIIEVEGEELKVDSDYDWELDSVVVEPYTDEGDENRYVAKVALGSVNEEYLNQPFNVDLGIKFIPDIDTVTYNKEIARVTGLSVRAIENKRYRLRKKLNLNTEVSLDSFIHSFNSIVSS